MCPKRKQHLEVKTEIRVSEEHRGASDLSGAKLRTALRKLNNVRTEDVYIHTYKIRNEIGPSEWIYVLVSLAERNENGSK